jgi:ABC-type polysaccharide/polyol phosphate export permease
MILDKAFAVLKKDALTAWRYRNGFVLNAVAPAAQLATFYYLSRAIGPQFRPEGMPYFSFLLVGTGLYSFLLTGIYAFLRTVQEAQQGGTLEVLMTNNTHPVVLLCLSAVSTLAGAFLQFLVYIGAGTLLFAHGLHINLLGTVLVFACSLLIAVAIGMLAAGLQISLHKGSAVVWALGSSSWLMAGTLFPIASLPSPIRTLSILLPFTHSLTGMRLALLQPLSSVALQNEIATLFLFALVLLPFSIFSFSWTVRRARQLGTLSFY